MIWIETSRFSLRLFYCPTCATPAGLSVFQIEPIWIVKQAFEVSCHRLDYKTILMNIHYSGQVFLSLRIIWYLSVLFNIINVVTSGLWRLLLTLSYTGSTFAHYHNCCTCVQYIPRNMHTVFALLCFVVVIHWLIFPYPSGLLHWHCGNLAIAPVPAKQPWWIWINW